MSISTCSFPTDTQCSGITNESLCLLKFTFANENDVRHQPFVTRMASIGARVGPGFLFRSAVKPAYMHVYLLICVLRALGCAIGPINVDNRELQPKHKLMQTKY